MDITSDRNTIQYIRVLRCFATYCVIALHCISPYIGSSTLFGSKTWWVCDILNSIVRMGVPLFFMISGFLLLSNPKSVHIKAFYAKRIQKILLPFLCWDIVYFFANASILHQPLEIGRFFRELLLKGSEYHLWFVYQIIGIYLLTPFLKRILDHCEKREQALLLVIVLLQPTLFLFLNSIQTAVKVAPFPALMEGYVGFFIFGYILGSYELPLYVRRLVYFGGAIGFAINVFGNYSFSSSAGVQLVFNAGYSITHYLTAGAFFVFIKRMDSVEHPRLIHTACNQVAARLDPYSFGIYLSHILILKYYKIILYNAHIILSPACNIAVSFLTVAFLSTLLIFLLSKCKLTRKLFL